MAIPTVIIGALLIAVGLFGYFTGTPALGEDAVSITALIPAFFGAVLAVLGLVAAQVKGKGHMHVMHAAVLIGLIGVVGAGMRIPGSLEKVNNEGADPLALYCQAAMALLCLAFVALCVRSFIIARIIRKKAEAAS